MNFTVEYVLPDSKEVKAVLIQDCENLDAALKEFKKQHGNELAERVLSIYPTTVGL